MGFMGVVCGTVLILSGILFEGIVNMIIVICSLIIMILVSSSSRLTENYRKYLLKTAVIIELLFSLILIVFLKKA